MRKGRASRTAQWVSLWRGLGRHFPDLAHDPVARALVGPLSRVVLDAAEAHPSTARAIASVATRASGGLARHLPMRTRAIDEALTAEVHRGARQVILLGAGLDARGHRLGALEGCVVFEVDHPDTQAYKLSRAAELPRVAEIRYVPVDFAARFGAESLVRALDRAGFDRGSKVAIVWEGVIMYLPRAAIEATLDVIGRVACVGSSLLVTYYDTKASPFARLARPLFRAVGEPLVTQLSRADMRATLGARGFDLVSDEGDEEWTPRWLSERAVLSMSERLAHARKTREP